MLATLASAAVNGVCSPPIRCSFVPISADGSARSVVSISDGSSYILLNDERYLKVTKYEPLTKSMVDIGGRSPVRPTKRNGFSCVSYRDRIFIFGGRCMSEFSNELWSFNPSTECWKKVIGRGVLPCPRANHSAVVYRQYMFIFSGLIGGGGPPPLRVTDFWCYNFETLSWYNLGPVSLESMKASSSAALLSKISKFKKQCLYRPPPVFYSRDELPPPRDDCALALVGDKIYVNGGQSNKTASASPILADTWIFDLVTGEVAKVETLTDGETTLYDLESFLPRSRHCGFELNGHFGVLGGVDTNGLLMKRDMWVLLVDAGKHFWRKLPPTIEGTFFEKVVLSGGVLGTIKLQRERVEDWRECVKKLCDLNALLKSRNSKLVDELQQAKNLLTKAVVRASVSKARDEIEKRHTCVICMTDEAEVSNKLYTMPPGGSSALWARLYLSGLYFENKSEMPNL